MSCGLARTSRATMRTELLAGRPRGRASHPAGCQLRARLYAPGGAGLLTQARGDNGLRADLGRGGTRQVPNAPRPVRRPRRRLERAAVATLVRDGQLVAAKRQ